MNLKTVQSSTALELSQHHAIIVKHIVVILLTGHSKAVPNTKLVVRRVVVVLVNQAKAVAFPR
jgi:hypothetical protein